MDCHTSAIFWIDIDFFSSVELLTDNTALHCTAPVTYILLCITLLFSSWETMRGVSPKTSADTLGRMFTDDIPYDAIHAYLKHSIVTILSEVINTYAGLLNLLQLNCACESVREIGRFIYWTFMLK